MTFAIMLDGLFVTLLKRIVSPWHQKIPLASFPVALALSGELGNLMPIFAVAVLGIALIFLAAVLFSAYETHYWQIIQ